MGPRTTWFAFLGSALGLSPAELRMRCRVPSLLVLGLLVEVAFKPFAICDTALRHFSTDATFNMC